MFRSMRLRQRMVIDISTAEKLGFVNDIEINESTGNIESVIVPQKYRFFSRMFGKGEIIIPWKSIEAIGHEVILVRLSDITHENNP